MQMRHHFAQQLDTIDAELVFVGQAVVDQVLHSITARQFGDRSLAAQVLAGDLSINAACERLKQRVIACIATQQPVARDLRRLVSTLDICAELERIADYAKNLGKLTMQAPQPAGGDTGFVELAQGTLLVLNTALHALAERNAERAYETASFEASVDVAVASVRLQLLMQAQDAPETAGGAINLMFSVYILERIADRATNIAEAVIYCVNGELAHLNADVRCIGGKRDDGAHGAA